MNYVDMDALFKRHLLSSIQQGADPQELEDDLPDLYLQWLQTPNDALGGIAPGAYYCGAGADELIRFLIRAIGSGKKPDDPLLDAIVDMPETEPLLLDLLRGNTALEGEKRDRARREAADLLNQKQSQGALTAYIEILNTQHEPEELRSLVADAVAAIGEDAKETLLAALADANDEAAACMLDLLCELEADERTYVHLLERFHVQPDRREFYAKLLERYGDERAVKPLAAALRGEGYFNYVAIRNAIEALGGVVDYEPEFSGDSEYESMKRFKGE